MIKKLFSLIVVSSFLIDDLKEIVNSEEYINKKKRKKTLAWKIVSVTLAELIRKYHINISPERLSGCLRSTNMEVVVN